MKYGVIAADPPWKFDDTLTMSEVPRGAAANYPLLDLAELCKLPVAEIAEPDAVLLLWVPASIIRDGLAVMEAWGFGDKQIWVWVKTAKPKAKKAKTLRERVESGQSWANPPSQPRLAFGMGRLARSCKEIALIGIRGKPYGFLVSRSERDVFFAPAMPHSKKPDEPQRMLDRMFPTRSKIELFARRQLENWTCVGNEAPETFGEDIRDTLKRLIADRGVPAQETTWDI